MNSYEHTGRAGDTRRRSAPPRGRLKPRDWGRTGVRHRASLLSLAAVLAGLLGFAPDVVAQEQCTLAPPPQQPTDAMVMTTVATDFGTAKTVKVEKETFLCNGGAVVKDVNIFTEIIEDLFTGEPLTKQFEVETCLKSVRTPFEPAKCTFLAAVPPPPRADDCRLGRPPGTPLALNTVTFQGIVKTVKTEKEKFLCGFVPGTTEVFSLIVDLNVFTEIFEFPDGATFKTSETALCVKDTQGDVLGCEFLSAGTTGPASAAR